MVSLITGRKGSGKTKRLIEQVNKAVEASNGNVVCVEKERLLTYDINYRARLIETDFYKVSGYKAFYGFLSGICAGDHDITQLSASAAEITMSLRFSLRRSRSSATSPRRTSYSPFRRTKRSFPRRFSTSAIRFKRI